jgi:hypothetical protein
MWGPVRLREALVRRSTSALKNGRFEDDPGLITTSIQKVWQVHL